MPTLLETLEFSSIVEVTSSGLSSEGDKDATQPHSPYNPQSTHRRKVFHSWLKIGRETDYDLESNIVGKQTLDIGCGQGDMIELFAATLKAQGNQSSRVVGVDPASLDYGEPWTLGDAQAGLLAGPVGEYLSFRQTTAPALVASQPTGTYSVAYFAHSLYYFPSYATIIQNFKSLLNAGVQTLLLAEWSLSISDLAALPHLLAVLLQSIDPISDGNVRTVLSPAAYMTAAMEAGWEVASSETFAPVAGLEDGKWETGFARTVAEKTAIGRQAVQTVERSVESVQRESLTAHADALEASIVSAGGVDRVRCMDVWTAIFRPAASKTA
ncbi:hypothetical protein NA57DRAFT_56602 [Rhizodiscina lignyota]|uniref:Methyltransferase domain-containing protein n=1 Tax=Rhizodiscina lignyota TaxID=1504668 RepID=A0A9P4IDR8_9PEZI|nr:hypothetical protein NA57DRAFT_56602 [Rhizodiscina lignyota]